MKITFYLSIMLLCGWGLSAQDLNGSPADRQSLDKATAAIRDAFAKGDAALAVRLHSPHIVKYFGGKNVIVGREALMKQLQDWFNHSTVEFIENKVETTVFSGETAIQTVIFAIKSIPKNGGKAVIARGRSMVVYVKEKTSLTGWLSLREITQEAPPENE